MSNQSFFEDDLAILAEFVDESESDLDKVAANFVELENRPDNLDLVNAVFRPIHSIKGNSAFLGLMKVRNLAHEMETVLDDFRKKRSIADQEKISLLLRGVDELKAILFRIRNQEPEISDTQAFKSLVDEIRSQQADPAQTTATPSPASSAPSEPVSPVPSAPADDKDAPRAAIGRTVRVQERYLDELRDSNAELIRLQQKMAAGSGDADALIKESASYLAKIIADMEERLTALCAVSVAELLQRAPRIARETAAVAGKSVKVNIAGEDLRVPKSTIEILETPLMHIVRNAVDHGLERPDARRRASKPEEGQLWVEAREEKTAFILRIADDGGGIDFKALLTKAMAMGACPRDRSLTPEDVLNLIFIPGVSAAKNVTDISGRGVGMDVVKSQIEAAGGKIQVSSKTGKGAEFIIRLPR